MIRVRVDGSYGEGGGQVLRTAVSLAAITGRPTEIASIRARRAKPGLQPQHLAAVRAAAALCAGRLEGDLVGSTHLLFEPGAAVQAGEYRFDIGTAGAAGLVIQTVAVPLALAGGASRVVVTGGTHVPHAPAAEYLQLAYLPAVARAGLAALLECPSLGFYPRGGGQVTVSLSPCAGPLLPLDLAERGKLEELVATIDTSGLPDHVGRRGAATVEAFMRGIGRAGRVVRRDLPSAGPGAAVVVTARCAGGHAGFTALGARGKPMETVAEDACRQFLAWWKADVACDEHMADQLVLPAALAAGESRWTAPSITEHLRTVLWVASLFLPIRHTIDAVAGGGAAITVSGGGALASGEA